MRRIFYLLPAILMIAFVSSCDKDDDNTEPEKFSQKTVEENKEIVELSAIQMAETMGDMKNLETTDVAVNLSSILDMADPFEEDSTTTLKVSSTIHALAGIQSGKSNIHDLFTAMKSSGELEADPETLQEIWDDIKGTYSWNTATEKWDYTSGGDIASFEFPSTENGTSNNAAFTISEYKGVVTANPLDEEYDGDIPTSLMADLSVDGTALISYTFAASYNSDGIPTSVASDLSIETFTFSVDITNSDTEVSAMYKMTHGETTVMDIGGTAKGLFTQANIDNNTVTETDTWTWTDYQWNEVTQIYEMVEITETDEWEEVAVEEIINSAEAHFQLFDIALKGDVDVKSLVDEMNLIYLDDESEDFDEQAASTSEAEAINMYLDLRAVNVTSNEKIAEVEAYVVHDVDEYYDDYYIDFRLVFGDGSPIDLETYFDNGFEDFVAEINTLIRELNSEYEWDLEEIVY